MADSFWLLDMGFYFIVSSTFFKKTSAGCRQRIFSTKWLRHILRSPEWVGVRIELQSSAWEPNSLLVLVTPVETLGTSTRYQWWEQAAPLLAQEAERLDRASVWENCKLSRLLSSPSDLVKWNHPSTCSHPQITSPFSLQGWEAHIDFISSCQVSYPKVSFI